MSNIIAKLFSARQSVQETIETSQAKNVTAPVEIELKTEIDNDDLSHPLHEMRHSNEQGKVNSAAIKNPVNVSVRSEVKAAESVLADKTTTERIARKRQSSEAKAGGAEVAFIGKQHKTSSQASME